MKDNFNRGVYIYLIIMIGLAILTSYYLLPMALPQEAFGFEEEIRVIDGDTFEYKGEIIRLICIDSPERGEEGFLEAGDYLESLILNNEIRMEKDVRNKDEYGRSLRYVYSVSGDEEVFVNKEMVKSGNAEVFRYGEDTKKCDEIEG